MQGSGLLTLKNNNPQTPSSRHNRTRPNKASSEAVWGEGGGKKAAVFRQGAVTWHFFEAEISAPFLVCCYFAFNDMLYKWISRN